MQISKVCIKFFASFHESKGTIAPCMREGSFLRERRRREEEPIQLGKRWKLSSQFTHEGNLHRIHTSSALLTNGSNTKEKPAPLTSWNRLFPGNSYFREDNGGNERVYAGILQLPSFPDEGHAFLNACSQLFLRLLQTSSVCNITNRTVLYLDSSLCFLRFLFFCAGKVSYLSYSLRGPRGKISSAPFRPSRTLVAKKGSSVT